MTHQHNAIEAIDLTLPSPVAGQNTTRPRTRSTTQRDRGTLSPPTPSRAASSREEVIDIADEDDDDDGHRMPRPNNKRRRGRTTPLAAGPSAPAHPATPSLAASTPEPPGAYRARRRGARTPAPVAGPSHPAPPQEAEEGEIIVIATPPAAPARRTATTTGSDRTLRSSRPRIFNGIVLPPHGRTGIDPAGVPGPANYYLPPDPPRIVSRPRRSQGTTPGATTRGGGAQSRSRSRKRKLPVTDASTSGGARAAPQPEADALSSTGLHPGSRCTSPLTPLLSSASNPGSPKHSPRSPPALLLPSPPTPTPPPALQPLTAYTCPICFSPPSNATITQCGHLMCGECLYSSVRANLDRAMQALGAGGQAHPQCPVCRADIHLAGTRYDGHGKRCAVGMWAIEEIEIR